MAYLMSVMLKAWSDVVLTADEESLMETLMGMPDELRCDFFGKLDRILAILGIDIEDEVCAEKEV